MASEKLYRNTLNITNSLLIPLNRVICYSQKEPVSGSREINGVSRDTSVIGFGEVMAGAAICTQFQAGPFTFKGEYAKFIAADLTDSS